MKKILIVDDDLDLLELTQNRLKANKFEVIVASNAKDGIQKAQEESPDLILMDVMMPHLYGGDAVRALKANAQTKNIPVVFLTAVYNDKSPEGEESKGINVAGHNYP